MTDILIKNGIIIDGTGNNRFSGNILIDKGIITNIQTGNTSETADLVINASKKVVCPGFIDVHSHFDFSYLLDKYAKYSIMQGITTEIVGNCGIGLAPMNETVRNYYQNYISFILGSLNIEFFNRISDFMNYINKNGCTLNIGFLIPQGNVRVYVMGMDNQEPNDDELKQMKQIVREGMEDGAFGISTGLIYPPGSITTTNELIELTKVVGEYGGIYSTHIRDEGRGIIKAINEALEIGKSTGASVEISHVKVAGSIFTKYIIKKINKMIKNAREFGVDVNGDMYPYTAANSVLSGLLQPWVFDGGDKAFRQNLTSPVNRKRIINEFKNTLWKMVGIPWFLRFIPKMVWMKLIMDKLQKKVIITSMKYKHEFEGKTLENVINTLYPGVDIYNATLNLLREEEGAILISMFLMKKKDVIKLMKSPYLMFSTDNLCPNVGKPHPRVLGTYPRILGRCVRQSQIISLEEAIYKMTGFPAKKFSIDDRGIIKEDFKADIVIFDPDTVIDTATHQNPISFPKGIHKVIVNGKVVMDEGKLTEELPGMVIQFK